MHDLVKSYDPDGLCRSTLKRAGAAAIQADITRIVLALAAESAEANVTRDRLFDAGFTNGEIDQLGDAAIADARLIARHRTRHGRREA